MLAWASARRETEPLAIVVPSGRSSENRTRCRPMTSVNRPPATLDASSSTSSPALPGASSSTRAPMPAQKSTSLDETNKEIAAAPSFGGSNLNSASRSVRFVRLGTTCTMSATAATRSMPRPPSGWRGTGQNPDAWNKYWTSPKPFARKPGTAPPIAWPLTLHPIRQAPFPTGLSRPPPTLACVPRDSLPKR